MPIVLRGNGSARAVGLLALAWLCVPAGSRADPPAPPIPVRQLGEVNVTATRSEREVLEVAGNVTVLNRARIERSGAEHVAELLRREAGLFVTNTTTNPEGYTVEARGFNNGGGNGSSLLVLVDGRRINEASSSVADWALLRLDAVERVEIVRGPTSAVYGDNAVGGVVHILTREGKGPGTLVWKGRSGTFDTDGASLLAGGNAGPLEARIFLDGLRQDGFRERSGFRTRGVDGKFRLELGERLAAELTAGYTSDRRERPGTLTAEQLAESRRQADPSDEKNRNQVRARFVQGLVEFLPADDWQLRIVPFYRTRDDQAGIASSDPFSSSTFGVATDSEAKGVNLQLQIDRALVGHRNRLLVGADWLREQVESESLFLLSFGGGPPSSFPADTRSRRRLYGAYLQEEFNLTPNVLLTAGVRFEHARYTSRDRLASRNFRSNFGRWSPKASLTYRLGEPASVYVSFARGVRFPNFDEAFGFFGFTPGLKPQRSASYETGFTWRSERATGNLALYHMNVTDEILFDSEGPLGAARNVNFDRVRHRGIELSLAWRPRPFLELSGSYTLDDTRIRRDSLTGLDGRRVPITPLHRGSVGMWVKLPVWIDVGLNANLVGSRRIANDLENALPRLPKHARYDAVLRFRPPLGEHLEFALRFAVRNVFDRAYNEFAGERLFSPGVVGFNPAAGRSYEIALTLSARR